MIFIGLKGELVGIKRIHKWVKVVADFSRTQSNHGVIMTI